MICLVLKNRESILDFVISTRSDISNDINSFYLSIAGKVITINGYCEEENVFICNEYPEYVIPLEFISHKHKQIRSKDFSSEETFVDIAKYLGFTPQGTRALFNRAIEKVKKIINNDNQKKEYFSV